MTMSKKSEAEKAVIETKDDDEAIYEYDDDYWDYPEDDWQHELHLDLCDRVKKGLEPITPKLLESVTDPDWKRELIEAICLRQVETKKEK